MDETRYEAGLKKFREVTGEAGQQMIDNLSSIAPDLGRYVAEFGYADIYSRPGLDLKSRQLATVASLIGLGYALPQLKTHFKAALRLGWTREELIEIVLQVTPFVGFPAALNAMGVLKEVFKDEG